MAVGALSLGARAALIEAGSLATQLSEVVQEMRQSRERGREGGRGRGEGGARQEAFTQCHVTTIDCPFRLALLTSSTPHHPPLVWSLQQRRKQRRQRRQHFRHLRRAP